ncbi:MAG: alpha-mannosidase, partial [Spirulinaceae cyanobacterium RM2_2_10]|nr:alpha-mannosidase [Spirulinaceae cyanobacterium RM2_2_10]
TAEGQWRVLVASVPALGYTPIWVQASAASDLARSEVKERMLETRCRASLQKSSETQTWQLENSVLRVEIAAKTGNITALFDKSAQRDVLNEAANELQFFRDAGQYWDAWNIDPDYEQKQLPAAIVTAIEPLETGPVRSRLRVTRQFQQSTFQQDYCLTAHSPVLTIATEVDWQEQHVMVKAAFPLALEADFVTYEIPCGAIKRPTRPQTPQEQAKWEVCGQRWADLTATNGEYGVSVLNDCKYGYDHQPGQLRLTLLRAPQWPHPDSDRGQHRFTYALYPHSGGWQAAQTVRRAAELNLPLRGRSHGPAPAPSPTLPPQASLLTLTGETLMIMALKLSEDDPKTWILRVYEASGQASELELGGVLALRVCVPWICWSNRLRGRAIACVPGKF